MSAYTQAVEMAEWAKAEAAKETDETMRAAALRIAAAFEAKAQELAPRPCATPGCESVVSNGFVYCSPACKHVHERGGRMDGCAKCGGTGYLPQFAHVDGGTCYDCQGTGEA